MVMIHAGSLGKGLFAQASESQNCDTLILLLNVFFFQMTSSVLNLSIFFHPFLSENYQVLDFLDQWVINSQV